MARLKSFCHTASGAARIAGPIHTGDGAQTGCAMTGGACNAVPSARKANKADSAAADRPAVLPDGTRRVRGRIVTPRDSAMRAVPNAWVTLHRVASDRAGPLDSVRTGADGGYAFTYRPSGAANAIYFVSVQHDGIAYFSSPFRDAVVAGEKAEVTVFDTTSARVPVNTAPIASGVSFAPGPSASSSLAP